MDLREYEIDALRQMTAERKLAVLRALIRHAYELKAAGIRASRPGMPEHEVQARAREQVGGDRS